MSKRWTDEDVEELVRETEWYLGHIKKGKLTGEYGTTLIGDGLDDALAPFRPDPEEELIEAMAKEFDEAIQTNGHYNYPTEVGMRAAFAVIKEKGYFNDQR